MITLTDLKHDVNPNQNTEHWFLVYLCLFLFSVAAISVSYIFLHKGNEDAVQHRLTAAIDSIETIYNQAQIEKEYYLKQHLIDSFFIAKKDLKIDSFFSVNKKLSANQNVLLGVIKNSSVKANYQYILKQIK